MLKANKKRIFLSPPHMEGNEIQFIEEAIKSNYIAPTGPMTEEFEEKFCQKIGAKYALCVTSGTSALHLALILSGVGPSDEVLTSDLTFIASANPIKYLGGKPTFIDCDRYSWNMCPNILNEALKDRAKKGKLPKALVLVHVYGQSADIDPILESCNKFGVPLIEDAAESLGATYKGQSTGTFGKFGIFSFNGNKILTTSNGGMLVSNDRKLIEEAKFLAQQARDPFPHYEHSKVGYNYRLSNILAAIGVAQLKVLDKRIKRKKQIFSYYEGALAKFPGIEFMPEATYGKSTRWLTCVTIDAKEFGADREMLRKKLEKKNIESRSVWKPMHLQPVFKDCDYFGGEISEDLFKNGLCLPSGTSMNKNDLDKIVSLIIEMHQK